MNAESARTSVLTALAEFAPAEELAHLAPDVPLRDGLELDSLDFLTFVEQLSAATGRRIDESDYPELSTVDSCVRFLTAGPV